ncbi:MAG: DUF3576 domain-containing protein [Rhodospirillales bacterium]|jgi:hypothetical protein|nr:DUF3576 domain-containing protein [Rhodospirillales bacterium]
MKNAIFGIVATLVAASVVGGCDSLKNLKGEVDPDEVRTMEDVRHESSGKLFGEDAFTYGGPPKSREDPGGGGIGVNSFLWRASLDTISFMPVNSADPFGGVIITDWHSPPQAPSERFKMNVYIMGRALRADGVRVAVFRQVREGQASWRDAAVAENASHGIEDAILMKARQLRNQSLQ